MSLPSRKVLVRLLVFYSVVALLAGWRYAVLLDRVRASAPMDDRGASAAQEIVWTGKKGAQPKPRYRNLFALAGGKGGDKAQDAEGGEGAKSAGPPEGRTPARSLQLKGIAVSRHGTRAFVRVPETRAGAAAAKERERSRPVSAGERVGGLEVERIDPQQVTVEQEGGEAVVLKMFDRRDKRP